MGKDNNNIFGIAGGSKFIDFDILGYGDIVIFDNVFFEFSASFGGLDKSRGARNAVESLYDLNIFVRVVGLQRLLRISHLNYNQFIITLSAQFIYF